MNTIIISTIFMLLSIPSLLSQEKNGIHLSLHECAQTAVEKKNNVVKARIDKEKSGHKITETRSAFLPQVIIVGSYQNNMKWATTVLPGDLLGSAGYIIGCSDS